MKSYHCECCNFSTPLKSNYTRHLKTKKHQKVTQSYPKCYPKLPFSELQNIREIKNQGSRKHFFEIS